MKNNELSGKVFSMKGKNYVHPKNYLKSLLVIGFLDYNSPVKWYCSIDEYKDLPKRHGLYPCGSKEEFSSIYLHYVIH